MNKSQFKKVQLVKYFDPALGKYDMDDSEDMSDEERYSPLRESAEVADLNKVIAAI